MNTQRNTLLFSVSSSEKIKAFKSPPVTFAIGQPKAQAVFLIQQTGKNTPLAEIVMQFDGVIGQHALEQHGARHIGEVVAEQGV